MATKQKATAQKDTELEQLKDGKPVKNGEPEFVPLCDVDVKNLSKEQKNSLVERGLAEWK